MPRNTDIMLGIVLIAEISRAWGWIGIDPEEVVTENDFGNVIVRATDGRYWRITPEEGTCCVVADDRAALDILLNDQEFLHDWNMRQLVAEARENLGELSSARKYCLKIPGYLGGAYGMPNLSTAPIHEIIGLAGDIARQTHELHDDSNIQLKVLD
jgi:hypothetical protein